MIKRITSFALVSALLVACSNSDYTPQQITPNSSETGVIGGKKVSANDRLAKSTVGIYDRKTSSLCTGTIIDKDMILTAAHCVTSDYSQLIVFFTQDIDDLKKKPELVRKAKIAVQHGLYNPEHSQDMHDIALIRIQGTIPAGFTAAPLLKNFAGVKRDSEVIVAGYGLNWSWGLRLGSGILRTTTLKVAEPVLGQTELVLDQSLRRGVCSGDSGGPMYVEVNGVLHVAGVASRGDSLPTRLTPDCFILSVYGRVDAHTTWISEVVELLRYL